MNALSPTDERPSTTTDPHRPIYSAYPVQAGEHKPPWKNAPAVQRLVGEITGEILTDCRPGKPCLSSQNGCDANTDCNDCNWAGRKSEHRLGWMTADGRSAAPLICSFGAALFRDY